MYNVEDIKFLTASVDVNLINKEQRRGKHSSLT